MNKKELSISVERRKSEEKQEKQVAKKRVYHSIFRFIYFHPLQKWRAIAKDVNHQMN